MKYDYFKWYKIPKRGLHRDASMTCILIKTGNVWYLSHSEVICSDCYNLHPTHFMLLPGMCDNWGIGPKEVQNYVRSL